MTWACRKACHCSPLTYNTGPATVSPLCSIHWKKLFWPSCRRGHSVSERTGGLMRWQSWAPRAGPRASSATGPEIQLQHPRPRNQAVKETSLTLVSAGHSAEVSGRSQPILRGLPAPLAQGSAPKIQLAPPGGSTLPPKLPRATKHGQAERTMFLEGQGKRKQTLGATATVPHFPCSRELGGGHPSFSPAPSAASFLGASWKSPSPGGSTCLLATQSVPELLSHLIKLGNLIKCTFSGPSPSTES